MSVSLSARKSRNTPPPAAGLSIKWVAAVCFGTLIVSGGLIWFSIDPDPATILARELQSGDVGDRYSAAKDLEELGPHAVAAVPQLAEALGDAELQVRYRAAKALAQIGPPAAAAVPALANALKDSQRDVRYYAAKALYKIDNDAEAALEQVMDVLDQGEPDADVRRYLVKTLGEIGDDSAAAHQVIKKLVRDRDQRVREEVAEILAEFQQETGTSR